MVNRKKNTPHRPSCQRKKGKNGTKTLRNIPELYNQKKQQFNATLTPQALSILEKVANLIGDSRSQVIEKTIRGEIDLLKVLQDNGFTE